MLRHYILGPDGEPILEPDFMKWALWFSNADAARRVAYEVLGEVTVSTVFLGLDQRFTTKGPPLVWETLILGGKHHGKITRCAGSREQAEAMHQNCLKFLRENDDQPRT
jgi:hypothetical protein